MYVMLFATSRLQAHYVQSVVVCAVLVGAMAGSAIAAPCCDRKGRRLTVLLGGAIYFVGVILSAAAVHITMLVIARVIVSFCLLQVFVSNLVGRSRNWGMFSSCSFVYFRVVTSTFQGRPRFIEPG